MLSKANGNKSMWYTSKYSISAIGVNQDLLIWSLKRRFELLRPCPNSSEWMTSLAGSGFKTGK